jgi:amidase
MIYASKRQDTVGVLTRTVKDAMYITLALTEEAERNSLSPLQKRYSHPEKWISDFRRACNAENMSLAGIRIGIPVGLADIEDTPTCKLRSFERVLALMENSGAETIREVELTGACEYQNLSQEERQITLDTEMKVAINTYLSSLLVNPKRIKNLQDLIEFTKACSEEEYPARNVEGLERAQATNTENEMYKAMCEKDRYFSSCIERTLNRIECDLIVVPTLSVTLQSVAAKAGSPVMSILIGIYPKGTPVETDPKNGLITAAPGIP